MSIDLLVGGTLGGWALERADPAHVHQAVCATEELAAQARARGLAAFAGDPHDPAFTPGPAALSVHYPRILRPELIAAYGEATWNLHPGLLPWGRGMYPVFWALWEGTPAGATLHRLTAGLDRGPVVEQVAVEVREDDTGGSLHARVQAAERELFDRWMGRLAAGERPAETTQAQGGSSHDLAEFVRLRDEGDPGLDAAGRERLARCLAFPAR